MIISQKAVFIKYFLWSNHSNTWFLDGEGDKTMMQDIIKKIISIDQNAKDMTRNNDLDIKAKEEATRQGIDQMKVQLTTEAKQQGQMLYDERINKANKEAERMISQSAAKVLILEQHYLSIKDVMESNIFKQIFVDIGEEKHVWWIVLPGMPLLILK